MKPRLIIGNKNYSSWSLRAWLLLREADIDFDEHRIPLDTENTKKLWPEDAAARAHARSISAEMHSGFEQLRSRMPMNCRAMGRRVALPDELTRDIDRIIEIWSDCHRRYGDTGHWLFGEFSIADAMYAPVVLRLRTYGINLPESAGYYAHRVLQSEAMQEWLFACETEIEVIAHEELGQ
jgi:glutathione S-transferase